MWEFPGVAAANGETTESAAVRALRELAGMEGAAAGAVASVTHVFTHVKVVYDAYRMEPEGGVIPMSEAAVDYTQPDACVWSTIEGLATYALPRAQQKIAAFLPYDYSADSSP
jgi:ADP-ribose pyrophosphatase YjhB (NUDIX family)